MTLVNSALKNLNEPNNCSNDLSYRLGDPRKDNLDIDSLKTHVTRRLIFIMD